VDNRWWGQAETLQQLLTGAKKQPDDPAEVPRLEKELAAAHAELAALKKA
jgi:transposase-like protein